MIRFTDCATSWRRLAAISAVLVAGLVFASAASALDLDFNVASGNFTTVGNWLDTTNPVPVPAAAAPGANDTAWVRNGGTVTINSDVIAKDIRIGARRAITPPDYNGDGVIDVGDYVTYRKGGTLLNDSTAGSVGPEDYLLWRARYGTTTAENDMGGPGTLIWTAGEITGPTGFHTGGPSLQIGRHVNLSATQLTEYDHPGVAIQNGATTKIMLISPQSVLNIGENGSTPTPLNSYTLQNGTIGTAIGGSGLDGANGNNGINVKNGTFTMTGGQIVDATPEDLLAGTLTTQRFITIGAQTGTPGAENYASATFTGGLVNVYGGIRVAPSGNSRGYLNINGPIVMTTGGDTSIGYNATNGVGEMNMSAGTLNVGRSDVTDIDPNTGNPRTTALLGRLQIGHRGRGTLNMSGGAINVTREIRVGAEYAAGGSIINQTGGTIVTPALSMGVNNDDPLAGGYLGATILVNGPTASFTQTGSSGTIIGYQGKATFEIQQGTALLGGGGSATQVGRVATSEAIINVKGGKLTLGGTLIRTNVTGVAPVVKLTGGTLEWNNTTTTAAQAFQADLTNEGTTLVAKPGALQQITVGRREGITPPLPAIPSNFAMTSGSWNIDIDSTIATTLGADWFNAAAGAASLTGGTLNINFLSGTPADGQLFRILRGGLGTTLGSPGSVSITGAGAGHWTLVEAPIVTAGWPLDEEIQLRYSTALVPGSGAGLGSAAVPEPSSAALVVFAAVGLLTRRGARGQVGAARN